MIDTSIQRVEINQVIENQLPEFVQSESPLFVDFMKQYYICLLYTSPSPRDATLSRMPSSA